MEIDAPRRLLERACQEAAGAVVCAARHSAMAVAASKRGTAVPASTLDMAMETAMVPAPGTAAFRDWATVFADAGDGVLDGVAGGRVELWRALVALGGAGTGDLRLPYARRQLLSDVFAARARAAVKRMRVICAHISGGGAQSLGASAHFPANNCGVGGPRATAR